MIDRTRPAATEHSARPAVTQRPRQLTRAQLRELRALLDQAEFREAWLQSAWREKSNAYIAATIIGFVRQADLGDALVPYEQRADRAMQKMLASRSWTAPQRKWLERIGKQLELQVVVTAPAWMRARFREEGGFEQINKRFEGKLGEVLGDIQQAIWRDAGATMQGDKPPNAWRGGALGGMPSRTSTEQP